MSVQIGGAGGVIVEVDSSKNIFHRRGPGGYGILGGSFSVAGGPSAAVGVSLAANTVLASLRHGAAATSNLWVTRIRTQLSGVTIGTTALVPGQIAWQRFTTATPTGGTARTPARKDATSGSATQVADVRDSNAALTVTSVNFTDIFSSANVPIFIQDGSYEWIVDLDEDEFIKLVAGDGICLRTQVAMPATQTWIYAYTIHYLEK